MTDKERILMTILNRMHYTQILCLFGIREAQFADGDNQYVHFGGYDDRPVQPGDLVLCNTTGIHDWKIGWVHEISGDIHTIREIGSDRLCNISNETFTRIAGLDPSDVLEGDEYSFREKVIKAFRRGDEYMYRFGGVDFLPDKVARVWVREAHGGFGRPSKPFSFEMRWNKKTTIAGILRAMIENGYGTRKFFEEAAP